MGLGTGDGPGGVGGRGGGEPGAQRRGGDLREHDAEGLAAHLADPLPVGGNVGVDSGAVPVGLPADRRTLGQQAVLAGEVRQKAPRIRGVAGVEGGGDDRRRPSGFHKNVVITGHGRLHDRLQQVPLAAPVVVQGLHGDTGPFGDAGHGGRRVAPLGELGPGRGQQQPPGLAPGRLARFPLPADPPGPGPGCRGPRGLSWFVLPGHEAILACA